MANTQATHSRFSASWHAITPSGASVIQSTFAHLSRAKAEHDPGAASGVRVNSFAPGLVETPIFGGMPLDTLVAFAGATQLVPRRCASEQTQIAKVVLFLASEDATMVTGSTYTMDGGWAMKA
ncbi:oxidoreductase, short chain dehydrogenase/reductase family protein [Ectocarpus siliculosus]|uniref:Oxidoreductase, short chain dehydrogenase/reductase family protein n=1 Tax=Ectocarpus siliculosus TaxID=2880 RepID=D7FY92_ECTSI|nr:oxidoreductase, short chain dehydrogenase/reductase family protein [Ectocarpus siliculosus]|eukprot:CBJ26531.1 oxidoreductase, short chain dehydrogenase/reductase family protein [Ectocarpus siliculosus]